VQAADLHLCAATSVAVSRPRHVTRPRHLHGDAVDLRLGDLDRQTAHELVQRLRSRERRQYEYEHQQRAAGACGERTSALSATFLNSARPSMMLPSICAARSAFMCQGARRLDWLTATLATNCVALSSTSCGHGDARRGVPRATGHLRAAP
jgi:hypothetical protein